uniref:Group vii salivary lipocalin n=1 Tax=Panagrellus redivivus TaxID=6233 RepID=A0A7E4V027_PANRE
MKCICVLLVLGLILHASCTVSLVKDYWKCNAPEIRKNVNIIAFEPLNFIFYTSEKDSWLLQKYREQCTCVVALYGRSANLMVNTRSGTVNDLALRCYVAPGNDTVALAMMEKRKLVASYYTDLPQYAFSIEPNFDGHGRERCKDPTGRPTRNLFDLLTCFVLNIAFGDSSTFIFAGPLLINSLPLIPYEQEVDARIWEILGESCEPRVAIKLQNELGYERDPINGDRCGIIYNITANALPQFLSICCCTTDLENCNYKKHRAKQIGVNVMTDRIQCALAKNNWNDAKSNTGAYSFTPKEFYDNHFDEWCLARLTWNRNQNKYMYSLELGAKNALCQPDAHQDLCPGSAAQVKKMLVFEHCCNSTDFCNYFELQRMIGLTKMKKCPYGDPQKAADEKNKCTFYVDVDKHSANQDFINIDESFLDLGGTASKMEIIHEGVGHNRCNIIMARLKKIDGETCQNKVYSKENKNELRLFQVCSCNGDNHERNCQFLKPGTPLPKPSNIYKCAIIDETIQINPSEGFKGFSHVGDFPVTDGNIGCYFRVLYDNKPEMKISAGPLWEHGEKCFAKMEVEVVTSTEVFYCHMSDSKSVNYKGMIKRFLGEAPKEKLRKQEVNVCTHRNFDGHVQTPDECTEKTSRCFNVRFATSTFTAGCDAGCVSNIDNDPLEPELELFGNYRAICDSEEFKHQDCHVSYPSAPENPRIVCCTDSGKAVINVGEMNELTFGRLVSEFKDEKKNNHARDRPDILYSYTSLDFNKPVYHNYFGDHSGKWSRQAETICQHQLKSHPPKRPTDYVFHLMPIYEGKNQFEQFMLACSLPTDDITATSGFTQHAIWEGDDGVNMMFQVLLNKFLEKHLLYDYSLEPMFEPKTSCIGTDGLRKKRIFNQNVCMNFYTFRVNVINDNINTVRLTYDERSTLGNLNVIKTAFPNWADEKLAEIFNDRCQSKPADTYTVDCFTAFELHPYQYNSFCCCSQASMCSTETYLESFDTFKCAYIDNWFASTADTMIDTVFGEACSMSIETGFTGITIRLKATSESECPPNGDFCSNSAVACSIMSKEGLTKTEFATKRIASPSQDATGFTFHWGSWLCTYGDGVTPYVIEGKVRCLIPYDPLRKKVITGGIIGRFRNVTSSSFWDMDKAEAFPVEILLADPPSCSEQVYTEKDVGNGALIWFTSCTTPELCDEKFIPTVANNWNFTYHRNMKWYNCESITATEFKYDNLEEAFDPSRLKKAALSWGCWISIERKADVFVLVAKAADSMVDCLDVEVTEEKVQCCVLLTVHGRANRGDCTVKRMVTLYAKPLTVNIGFPSTNHQSHHTRCLSSFLHSDNIKYSQCEADNGCVGIQPTNAAYDLYEDCVSDLEDLVIDYPHRNYTMGGMLCREHFEHPECIYTYTFTKDAPIGAVVCCCQENECGPWEGVDEITKGGKKIGEFADNQ